MNNTFEQSKMRFKLPVRILSGVALLCAFFYGFFNFGIYVNTVIIESRFYFWILLDAILSIIPYALLLAFYLFFYCRKEQKAFLILILVLKLFVVPVFSSCISDIFMLRNPLELFFAYVVAQLILWSIPFILLLISVIRNFSNRLLFIIPIFLIIVVFIIDALYEVYIINLYNFLIDNLFNTLFNTLFNILFYTTILLYGFDARIPKKKQNISPEQALRNLNIQYEQKAISYEVYQQRRIEIIKKL